jgi:hypothetical protein
MEQSRILLYTLLLCLVSTSAFAQATERAKRRAERRANQRIDQKVDEAVDKVFDGLFGKRKKNEPAETDAPADAERTEDNRPGTSILDRLGGSDAEWEPVRNDYPMSFRMAMSTTKRGQTEEMIIDISLGEWKTGYRIINPEGKQGTMRIILDNQEGTMTTINEEEGKQPQGIQMSQRMFSQGNVAAVMEEKMDDYTFRKTGRIKVIDGYNCEEYEIEGPEGSGVSWVTNDIELDWPQVVQGMTMGMQGQQAMPGVNAPYQGFPIESVWTDAKGKETTVARYQDIRFGDDIDRSLLETGDIPIQKLGGY